MRNICNFIVKSRYLFYCAFFFLCIGFSGCATVSVQPKVEAIEKGILLTDICRENNIQWQWDSTSQVITLTKGSSVVKALAESDIVLFNDEEIFLSASLEFRNSNVYIPMDFKTKIIDRLIQDTTVPKLVDYTPKETHLIILDAGHGGKDPGAIGPSGLQEKEVVLDITLRVKNVLEKKGFEIVMTRDKDIFISLNERTEIASKTKADLFVSIHANSNPSKGIQGLEVYTLKDLNAEDKKEEQRLNNRNLLLNCLEVDKNNSDVSNIIADMLYTHKQNDADILALNLSAKTTGLLKARNLGRKKSRFYVLRNTLIPSILVEVGFLTNPKEENLLSTPAYRQRIAIGLANSIVEHIHGM